MKGQVLDAAEVARIRLHAQARGELARQQNDDVIAACWKSIAEACRELDPTAIPASPRRTRR